MSRCLQRPGQVLDSIEIFSKGIDLSKFIEQGYKTEVGIFQENSEGDHVKSDAGSVGFLLYGPYSLMNSGRYRVEFKAHVDRFDKKITARFEIVTNSGQLTLSEQSVSSEDLFHNSRIELEFQLGTAGFVEFRVFTFGTVGLSLIEPPGVWSIEDGRPQSKIELSGSNVFFHENTHALKALIEHGASLRFDQDIMIINWHDISFCVETREDIQLVTETIANNEYGLDASGNKLVIDIGMNVGLVSLYMANIESVIKVYSFEPFSQPYSRAQRNFALNPKIASKINASPFGLSGRNEMLDVFSNREETIGTSIRGLPSGVSERIQLRAASEVLAPLFQQAMESGLMIVIKMDCEGSEFAIMEDLEKKDLLRLVDVIMLEWHKWWALDLTQRDLIKSMIAHNFVVFDRTSVLNPHAGMLYAARRR